MEYAVQKKTTLESHLLLAAIKEDYRGFGGKVYEKEIKNSMKPPAQLQTSTNLRMLQMYPAYKEKNWHQAGKRYEQIHVAEVRDVNSKERLFSLRPKVMHAMQDGCPAIDFYFIKKEESIPPAKEFLFSADDDCEELVPGKGGKSAVTCHEHALPVNDRVRYTLYLIQSTVGSKHSMPWKDLQEPHVQH